MIAGSGDRCRRIPLATEEREHHGGECDPITEKNGRQRKVHDQGFGFVRVVEGGKIELELVASQALAGSMASIGVRQVGRVDQDWSVSDDIENSRCQNHDQFAGPERMPTYPDGTKLEVAMRIQTSPGAEAIFLADQKPIYYPRADAARVSVSGSGTPGSVLTLTFPANAKLAFPGLDANTRIKFTQGATPASPLPESFETDQDPWVLKVKVPDLNDKGEVKISLDPNVPKLELSKPSFPDP